MLTSERFFYLVVAGILALLVLNAGLMLLGPLLAGGLAQSAQTLVDGLRAAGNL